jgi:hypothetical protein
MKILFIASPGSFSRVFPCRFVTAYCFWPLALVYFTSVSRPIGNYLTHQELFYFFNHRYLSKRHLKLLAVAAVLLVS